MHNPDASRFTSIDVHPDAVLAHAAGIGEAPKIERDNWMVAKSVVFCGTATAIVAAVGLMAEAFVL